MVIKKKYLKNINMNYYFLKKINFFCNILSNFFFIKRKAGVEIGKFYKFIC